MFEYGIKYGENNFLENAYQILMKEGLVVISNVFSNEECDTNMNNIVLNFENLKTGLDRYKLKTWKNENLLA